MAYAMPWMNARTALRSKRLTSKMSEDLKLYSPACILGPSLLLFLFENEQNKMLPYYLQLMTLRETARMQIRILVVMKRLEFDG